jgi:putative membrane protein
MISPAVGGNFAELAGAFSNKEYQMLKGLLVMILTMGTSAVFAANEAKLNDGQIAKILMTVDEGEIDAGELAEDKAQSPEVKDFAKMMITQHKQNKKDTKGLAEHNKLDAKKSDLMKQIEQDNKSAKRSLKEAEGKNFDKTYVDAMVAGHEKALQLLDNSLLPAAQNTDLRNHLTKTREAVAMHLDHAKKLQLGLKR